MCIVIDTNTLAPVFNDRCAQHRDFRPVKTWIKKRQGILVFGGTRYKEELKKAGHRYLKLVRTMKTAGQAVAICDEAVDRQHKWVKGRTKGTDCDDQHIIALLGASRCPLVCSADRRSHKHLKNRCLYPDGMKVKIYSSSRNASRLLQPMSAENLRNQA